MTKFFKWSKNTLYSSIILYATWHASIFDSFCGMVNTGSINFGTFGEVAHSPEEYIIFILIMYTVYTHILSSNYKNILILKKKQNSGISECITLNHLTCTKR